MCCITIKLAKLLWVPFRLLPRFYSSAPAYQTSVTSLLSDYRNTNFTLNDGLSEWKGDGGLWMFEQDSKILGLLQMKKRRTYWDLSSFVMNYQHRGSGYGKKMLECCIKNADAPVCLQVRQENPAYCLYKRLGFQTEGYADGRYFMKYQ